METLFPALEYLKASLQYADRLTIHTKQTTSEGKKPIPKISALTASTMDRTVQTVLVAE